MIKKIIRISLKRFIAIAASFVIVLFLGSNLYAFTKGYNNIFTTIGNMFNVNQKNYEMSENEINQTVESNGVKLTLKTLAMDDNVLIIKYIAEGEILKDKIITFESLTELVEKEESIKEQWKRGKGEEFDTTDVMKIKKEIENVLNGMTYYGDKSILLEKTKVAYQQLIKSNYGDEGYTVEMAQSLLNEAQALYESNIEKKNIINSLDKIANISINSIEQSVIKKDNKYEICVLYPIDTISELANEFNIKINIYNLIGIDGEWNYDAKLNKTNLNTKVQTIDFHNNKVNVLDKISVGVKKLSISDFSSVIMIQTDLGEYRYEEQNKENSIVPFVYLILDENGSIIGKGNNSKYLEDKFSVRPDKYTERLILKNVNNNTKILNIKVYSNNDNKLLTSIQLNIEEEKNKNIVELNKEFLSEENYIAFRYPNDWEIGLKTDKEIVAICSPTNVDDERSNVRFSKTYNLKKQTAMDFEKTKQADGVHINVIEEGEIIVNNIKGYYWVNEANLDGYVYNYYTVCIEKENYMYEFCYGGLNTQYKKHFDTFKRILETVEIQDIQLNSNKEIVYTVLEKTVNGSNVQIPAINLNNKIILEINEELYNYGKSKVEQLEKEGAIPTNITYKYYVNGNIVSLIARTFVSDSGEFNSYKVYNINKETGKIVSNKELIDISGIDNYSSKAQSTFQNKVYELYGKLPDEKEFDLAYEKTMVSANYDILNNNPIFLDENGDLNAIGKIYCPAGPEYLNYIINVENYTKFERNPQTVEDTITENDNEVIKEEKTDLEKVREIEESLEYKISKNGPTLFKYIWIDIPENVTLSQGNGEENLYGLSIWTNVDTRSRIKVYMPVAKAYNATSESIASEIVEKLPNYLRKEVKIIGDQEWYLIYYSEKKDVITYYMTTTKEASVFKIKVEYSNIDEESENLINKMVSSIAIPMG